jgi:hypothetical protein
MRLRYRTWKLRALCWLLRRLRAAKEHRDEAERMKEAAPEDSQVSSGSSIFAIVARACCRRSSINCSTAASRMSSAMPSKSEALATIIATIRK